MAGIRCKAALISLLSILFLSAACSSGTGGPSSSDGLTPVTDVAEYGDWVHYSRTGQLDSLIICATPVFRHAVSVSDTNTALYSAASLAQAWLFTSSDFDSVKYYLDYLEPFMDRVSDPRLTAMTSNTCGIYSVVSELNYARAMRYYIEGYAKISDSGYVQGKLTLLLNIVLLFYTMSDPSGIQYAVQAEKVANEVDIGPYYRASLALSFAQMHSLSSRCSLALEYLDSAKSIAVENDLISMYTPIYILHAELEESAGDTALAGEYFSKAFLYVENADPEAAISLYLKYGRWCVAAGMYGKALETFTAGLAYSYDCGYLTFRQELLKSLAELYHSRGDYPHALTFAMRHIAFQDSVSNMEREREFNNLLRSYDEELHNREIMLKELAIMKKEKANTVAVMAFCIVAAVAVIVCVYARKQKIANRKLVDRYFESQEKLASALACEKRNHGKEYADYGLFCRIDALMSEKKMYLKNGISLQMIADTLGTNKTYVSASINKYAGMSFYRYLDMYRIREATAILSSSKERIPFKQLASMLGYNTDSTFYSAFYRETGLTPGDFRNASHPSRH